MKKFGFTMAELLVTLTIVGVVAAITAPMVDNLLPDKNKSKVLKVYKTLSDINYEILNDPSLYMSDGSCEGLACTAAPSDNTNPIYVNAVGPRKYGTIVASRLDLASDILFAYNIRPTFTTKDGIWWQFLIYQVTVDVDPNSQANCSYGQNGCTKPDRYVFSVSKDGIVTGVDAMTQAYLLNPTKLNDKNTDKAKAKAILNSN